MPGNRKLGRVTAHRMSMLYGMAANLLEKGEIVTTFTRAKEVSSVTDGLITLGKKGDLASYRKALALVRKSNEGSGIAAKKDFAHRNKVEQHFGNSVMTREDVVKKLFDTIAPAYAELNGGYTQIFKLGPRRGDAAEMALIKLVEVGKKAKAPVVEEKKPAKKAAPRAKKVVVEEAPAEAVEAPVEAPAEEAPATEAAE